MGRGERGVFWETRGGKRRREGGEEQRMGKGRHRGRKNRDGEGKEIGNRREEAQRGRLDLRWVEELTRDGTRPWFSGE